MMNMRNDVHVSLKEFMSKIREQFSQAELDKCIVQCAFRIICILRSSYTSNFVNNIPTNYTKSKIMNLDIIDYLKLNMV